jgi:hypothetical protein
MRFEAKAAWAIGILLPALETYRRGFGHWRVEFTTMFEDYLAALLLLAAGWAAYRRHRAETALFTSLMTISFVDQVEVTVRGIDIEPQNTDVLVVKFLLFAVSVAATVQSFRRCVR